MGQVRIRKLLNIKQGFFMKRRHEAVFFQPELLDESECLLNASAPFVQLTHLFAVGQLEFNIDEALLADGFEHLAQSW